MDAGSPEPQALTRRSPAAREFLSIQALRGVAAMLVVVFHASSFSVEHWNAPAHAFYLGNAGVDVFFVISGFIMWTVTARRPTPPGIFLMHRAIRLIPLYWLFTGLKAVLAAAIPRAFPHFTLTARDLLLSLAFVPHRAPGSQTAFPVLGQGWTLNFEVFFYLLFAGVLALPPARRLTAITVVLIGAAALGIATAPPAIAAARLLNPLLLEFLAGIIIANLVTGGTEAPAWLGWAVAATGVALLLAASPMPYDPARSDDLARVWRYGVPAAMIVAGTVAAELRGRFPSAFPLKLLGDASYSIYLSHTFTVSVLGKLWRPGWPAWGFVALAVSASALAGLATYRFIETPLTAALRIRARRPALAA